MFLFKIILILSLFLSACTPKIYQPSQKTHTATLLPNSFISFDGTKLSLKKWLPETQIDAVLIALHGFNDYSHFIDKPANFFQKHNIATFAYDQRGFGKTPPIGLWAGKETYSADLALFINLIKHRYPKTPIYLLGESMGAAVVILANAEHSLNSVEGLILSAPAVWARKTMPWYQNFLLWSLSHTMPWLTLTGESTGVVASDNIEMLRHLSRDPLVIKETRVESIYGLVNLMDAAFKNAANIHKPSLILYGEKDEIIPANPTAQFIKNALATNNNKLIACYKNGYHMLLRDLQAITVWKDILNWMTKDKLKLPSKAETHLTCFNKN